MASKEQLRKVAIYCDSYSPNDSGGLKNLSGDKKFKSCENCIHYTNEGKCKLNLVDKILSSLAMELDFKS